MFTELHLQAEVSPEHYPTFDDLSSNLPPQIKLELASVKLNDALVAFPHPDKKGKQLRILDTRLGIFVPFPRPNTFALYMGSTVIFQTT